MIQTPVVYTIWNRPDIVERVSVEIAKARLSKIYVIADAPRPNHPGEAEKCEAARNVIDRVDWNCEVVKNYSDTNMGPRRRLSTGINWVFEKEEQAIILEHDCLPHPTFFSFCEQLIEKYRDDRRVMHINGNNFLYGRVQMQHSYSFSRITHPWGFATWRRAWQLYDVDMRLWPTLRNTSLIRDVLLEDKVCAEYFKEIFDKTFAGSIDTWDYQWLFACWCYNGLAVIPKTTLVSNIGFGEEALHCSNLNDRLANLPTEPMTFPLQHPPEVFRNLEADRYVIERVLMASRPNWFQRIKKGFRSRLN